MSARLVFQAAAAPAAPQGPGYLVTTFAADNISGCGTSNVASPTCYFNVDSTIAGKIDGLRVNPSSGQVWSLENEDANPVLTILDPATMQIVFTSPLPTETKFAGGYDDLAFTSEGTFMSASNPALTNHGINNSRTLVRVDFEHGRVVLTPVLPGQVTATDRSTGRHVKVNVTDPDSLSIIPGTNTIVLNDQGDSTLLFLDNLRNGPPNVSALFLKPAPVTNCGSPPAPPAVACPPIVDETTWATSTNGRFLVADHHKPGAIYSVKKAGGFAPGTAYTTVAPDNPTLADTLGTLDTTSGEVTAAVTGFSTPKGLIFLS